VIEVEHRDSNRLHQDLKHSYTLFEYTFADYFMSGFEMLFWILGESSSRLVPIILLKFGYFYF